MSTNKDLLKQAIAEAKTIREAAIANAKEALEESLTPHLKEMLAQKLQEMENEDEEVMDETIERQNGTETKDGTTKGDHGNEVGINVYEAKEEEEVEEPEEDEEEPAEEDSEENEEDLNIEDMSVEDLKDLIRNIVAQETGHDEESEMNQTDEPAHDDMTGMEDGEEEIDINEILAEIGMEDENMYEEMEDENTGNEMEEGLGGLDKPREIPGKPTHSYSRKPGSKRDDLVGIKGDGYTKELEEALDTVAHLRSQLQEVNLLNAKLLYVNKVFRANNLTEGQKVNVVAAFDKAETVKEVKLVFETVSKNVVAKPAIKEHRSFASKPAGSTQKQVINEVSEAVNRMQILAGIKPRQY